MRKPKYMQEMLKIICLWLGISFIAVGLLYLIGALKPKAGSLSQEPAILGIIFFALGIAFVITQAVLKAITFRKDKLHNELLMNGRKINGTVEKIYLQKYTQCGSQSPYRVLYSYPWQGRIYHRKSDLLWEKPGFGESDPIAVYIDDSGKSALQL